MKPAHGHRPNPLPPSGFGQEFLWLCVTVNGERGGGACVGGADVLGLRTGGRRVTGLDPLIPDKRVYVSMSVGYVRPARLRTRSGPDSLPDSFEQAVETSSQANM
jgi:hypothetical protein